MSGCSSTCQPKIPSSTPGAPGKNAYTFLVESFTMPAISATVTVTVSNAGQFGNRWAVVGQVVFVEGAGYFTVTAIVGTNQLTLFNLGYPNNTSPTTTIGSGGYISPAGLIGPQGTPGSNGVNGTARLYKLLTTEVASIINTWQALALYSVPADTLFNDGDSLVIEARVVRTTPVTDAFSTARRIFFGGQSATVGSPLPFEPYLTSQNLLEYLLRVEIIKTSSNTAMSRVTGDFNLDNPSVSYSVSMSGLNFTAPNQLILSVYQPDLGTELRSFTVDKIVSI